MPITKLTPQGVLQLRAQWAAGGITTYALAKQFGLSQGHVSRIVNGKTWLSTPAVRLALQKVFNDARE